MKKDLKRNKGITLIALIITIIVLLILVAVSVQVLIKSNLIGTAEKTTNKYKTAAEDERNLDAKIENGKSLDNYLEDAGIITEVHNWKREGDNITCEHCNSEFTIGETALKYEPNTDRTSTVLTHEQSGYTIEEYKEGEPTTYRKADQTIEREDVEWVVLGIEDKNNNGIYETLLITTQTPVSTSSNKYEYGKSNSVGPHIGFMGDKKYNNGPEQLNRMCEELYSNNEYGKARSIKVSDIMRCFEIEEDNLDNCYTYFLGKIYKVTRGTKLKDLPYWEKLKNEATHISDPNDREEALGKLGELGEYEVNSYNIVIKADKVVINEGTDEEKNFDISENARNLILGYKDIWEYYYWVADRTVIDDDFTLTMNTVIANQYHSDTGLIEGSRDYKEAYPVDVNGNLYFYGSEDCVYGLRPVVELRNKIPEIYSAPAVVTKSLDFIN